MKWYLVKLIFRLKGTAVSTEQFDEQLRMIQADTESEAYHKAIVIGHNHATAPGNQSAQACWEFIDLVELNEIGTLRDGVEIYYQVKEVENADQYIATIHRKSQLLGIGIA